MKKRNQRSKTIQKPEGGFFTAKNVKNKTIDYAKELGNEILHFNKRDELVLIETLPN